MSYELQQHYRHLASQRTKAAELRQTKRWLVFYALALLLVILAAM